MDKTNKSDMAIIRTETEKWKNYAQIFLSKVNSAELFHHYINLPPTKFTQKILFLSLHSHLFRQQPGKEELDTEGEDDGPVEEYRSRRRT